MICILSQFKKNAFSVVYSDKGACFIQILARIDDDIYMFLFSAQTDDVLFTPEIISIVPVAMEV